MIKLIALDMDGTLLDEEKKLQPAQIEAIHKAVEKGVKLVLCTGRPLIGVKPYYEELGLTGANEYVIVNNGCSTHQTSDWKLVDWQELSKEDMDYLYHIAQQSSLQLTLFDEEHYFVVADQPSPRVILDAGYVFATPTPITLEEASNGKQIIFQAMFLGEKEETDEFEEKFAGQILERFSGVRSQDYIYEAMPKGTTKASALASLAEKLDILPEEIMALGDANNDIEMLEFAGLGVAMGNASDHVKSKANAVTSSNVDNGVAKAIEDYILN